MSISRLPRTSDPSVAASLLALESQEGLSPEQAEELLSWLQETPFDSENFWVGEIAAALLRDRANPVVKARVRELCETAEEWQLYFYLIALMNGADRGDLEKQLKRAAASREMVIKAFALELQLAITSPQAPTVLSH